MTREATDLRTLWYMGAKTRLCEEFLDGAVRDLLEPGGTLLDACCGTAAVSRWFAPSYRILANDSQQFSAVVAAAHLEGDETWYGALDQLDAEVDLARACNTNSKQLEALVPEALAIEDSLLPAIIAEATGEGSGTAKMEEYRSFVETAPLPDGSTPPAQSSPLHQPFALRWPGMLMERQKNSEATPAVMCTAYWAHVYFGLRQAIRIDSLRYAISQIPHADPHRQRKQKLYLAALLHAVSVCTSGTSHFAQPRSIRGDAELLAVVRRRQIDIDEQFELALEEIRREWMVRPRLPGNRVFCGDIHQILESGSALDGEQLDLVYLDPPYTADNYSRFYHVLETLVNYDYPQLEVRRGEVTKGRYPLQEERFTSDFCSGVRVEDAFRRVALACKERECKLLISYSTDTGLLTSRWKKQGIEQPAKMFREILLEYFGAVEIREKSLMHSGQGDSNKPVRELLLLCEE